MAWRMKDVDWTAHPTEVIIAGLEEDIQEYIFNELQLSKIDFRYWAARYARIVDDKSRLVTFKPWASQEDFLRVIAGLEKEAWDAFLARAGQKELEAKMKIILLKSRQIGGTIISEILLTHLTIFFPNSRCVIASDHPDNSLKLSRVLMGIIDNLPGWMKPKMDAKVKATNYHFSDINADIVVGSGNQKTTLGQSMTIEAAHFTEVSTWEPNNAYSIDEDMIPAFDSSRRHHTLFVLESTGKGGKGNWFHDVYQAARRGDSQFRAIFTGWFRCPDKYAANAEGLELGDTVRAVARRIQQETGISLTKEQMAWYQIKRRDPESRGLLDVFLQEYPSTPEEAFQTGVRSVFPIELRSQIRNEVGIPKLVMRYNAATHRFRVLDLAEWILSEDPAKWEATLVIWEQAEPGHVYVVAHDASYGMGQDSSAIEVLRVGNRQSMDEQVAEFATNLLPPGEMEYVLWAIGHMYADKHDGLPAKMVIEVSPGSPGIVPQTALIRRGYPNFYIWDRKLKLGGGMTREIGWWTTPTTRTILTENGVDIIKRGNVRVNSPKIVDEMAFYCAFTSETGKRKLEHAPGEHDDRLMSLFMAFEGAHQFDSISQADEARREMVRRAEPEKKVVQFQALGLPWDVCIQRWEESMGL
jgi:hypothetical protein